jgi:hypothetical protein
MVWYCDILNCNNNSNATKGISYHEIPCDPLLRLQCLNLINANSGFREGTFKLKTGRGYDNTFICQAHFEETCYEPNRRRLKRSVVPTKFPPIPDVVCESATSRKPSRKRKAECCIMEVVDTPPKIGRPGKNNIYIGKLIKLYNLSSKFVNETSSCQY